MSKKLDLQKELDGLTREFDQLKGRRSKLAADLEGIEARAATLSASISAALLDGGDVTRDRESLAKLAVEESTLREAIAMADKKIRLLDQQVTDKLAGLQMFDFFEIVRKLESRTINILERGREISTEAKAIIEGYGALEKIAPIANGGDAVQILHGIAKRLNEFYAVKGENMLMTLEADHSNYLSAARRNE